MLPRRVLTIGVCLGVLVAHPVMWGSAQPVRVRLSQASVDTMIAAGRAAVEAGRFSGAVMLLRPLVERRPAARSGAAGAAAYWLGRACAAAGRPECALEAWAAGFEALQARGAFDARLADAFLRAVFERRAGGYYLRAADAYRQLIRRAGGSPSAEVRNMLHPHLEAAALLLSDARRQALGLAPLLASPESDEEQAALRLPEDVGARLLRWWRAQDPAPATAANERLHRHLERAVYARAHFAWHGRLDDRGDIYVRLGPPYKEKTIRFGTSRFRRKVLQHSPSLSATGFPDAVLWVYPHIDYAAHFLFIERETGRYLLGTPADLIPSSLITGLGPSARGRRKGEAYARTMALLYRQLALYHASYASLYNRAAQYVSLLEMQALTGNPLPPGEPEPYTFARSMTTRMRTSARRSAARRREAVPRSYTEPLRHAAPLVAENVRVVRFLESDGTTRTEIYWSLPAHTLLPSRERLDRLGLERADLGGRYLLSVVLRQRAAGYRSQEIQRHRALITSASGQGVLAPQTLVARGDTGRYHLALQWDVYLAYESARQGASPRLGPHLKTDTYHVDSLHALPSSPYRLVMSDLKPLVPRDIEAGALADTRPYPFDRITLETPLALYFEIYHLAYGEDDRTHYTVAYEIFRRTEQGLLEQIFTRADTRRTTTQVTYSGRSRTAEEYILLDLSEQAEPGKLVIAVRVTDEVTGRQTERSIHFEVVEAKE